MIKLKLTNGAGFTEEVELPEDNLWISLCDSDGTTRDIGSLYVEDVGGGAVRTTFGRYDQFEGAWGIDNEITV